MLETIRYRIEHSTTKSYKRDFPPIFSALNLNLPTSTNLNGLLQKVQRHVAKSKRTHTTVDLLQEVPEFAKHYKNTIGPHCEKSRLTPDSLLHQTDFSAQNINNAMIIELNWFRETSNTTWQTVRDTWWPNLFSADFSPPQIGTIQTNWHNLALKRQKLRHDPLKDFRETSYRVPTPRPPAQSIDSQDNDEDEDDDSDLEFYADLISENTLDHMGNCMEYLTDLWQEEVEDNQKTQKVLSRVSKALEDAKAINHSLKIELGSLQNKNVVRRLQRRKQDLEEVKKTNQRLNKKIEKLEERVKMLQKSKKNKGDSRRYFKTNRDESDKAKQTLNKQVKELETENEDLKCQLDDIVNDREIQSYENGKYINDIRLTCFELIARGVSSRNVSDIIRIVLKDVAKMKVGRLPKPTLIRYLCIEQAMLSKEAARAKIESSEHSVTLQVDGTTKKRKGYTTFLASTDAGTVGMSLHDIHTESAESLLEETKDTLDELIMLNIKDDPKQTLKLLAKIKNTMTDRCIVNKAYITKLEKWRAAALPQVTDNWEEIDDDVKHQLSTINDLFCGKHLVLNLQEYAASALYEWERIEADDGKLGRENKMLWSRGKESATLLTVRSFCNLLGPECDEQSGMVEDFKSVLKTHHQCKSHLQSYRGNRFNIPFQNSAAVFHHREHFNTLCSSLDSKREENMFVKCLKLDLQDEIILAGMRAMGIISQHITTPLMQMVESNLHVLDTDKFYTRLHQKVQEWMIDPSPLVNDSTILFPEFPPVKNEIHTSLYERTTGNIENLTKQALSVIMHNLHVCISRQVADHLPGGRFYNATDLREETFTCPKDNLAPERMFAGLDYLRRKMPNANTVAFEGILLWSLNKTREYLDDMDEDTRNKFLGDARKHRSSFLKLYQRKSAAIKKTVADKLKMNQEKKEARQRFLTKQAVENTGNALKVCGILCNSPKDVDHLKDKHKGKDLEQALTTQIKHWKSASKGGVQKDLFYLTNKGKKLSVDQLESNLRNIIKQIITQDIPDEDAGTSQSSSSHEHIDKEQQKSELKKKLLSKLSPTKKRRKGPFPGDRIIQKRIRHMFLESKGGDLVEYKAIVLRKATEEDIDELVEPGDRKYVGVHTFYTIMYDPPYQEMLCYPLEKEWDEGTLDLM